MKKAILSKTYPFSFEIAGSAAMFTNPATGAAPVSYPIPTPASIGGIITSVINGKALEETQVILHKIEICKPIRYEDYTTNYTGMYKNKSIFQNKQRILIDVCYKVYGHFTSKDACLNSEGINPRHKAQSMFLDRLKAGYFFTTPFLGISEFIPSYFGPLRESSKPQPIDMVIPLLVDNNGGKGVRVMRNIAIKKGVAIYDRPVI